jgi:GNAT superfamily N-acetyltransferase
MLKSATPSDLPAAVVLINNSYRGESSRQGWTHEADYIDGERISLNQLRAELKAHPQATLYIWRDEPNGPVLGSVWLEPAGLDVWYLGLLTVRPDLQARKLGRRILAEAEDMVRTVGGVAVRMTVVHVRDTLISWYHRRGYALTGETQPFALSDPPREDLHFVVMEKAL